MSEKDVFKEGMIKEYPHAHRKIGLMVEPYRLIGKASEESDKGLTTYISPYGLEFHSPKEYALGTLLKINIEIPDYWSLKQQFVDYGRIDSPADFRVLAKVVKTENIGKRGKKKLVLVQTVNIDEVDELVLKSYLHDIK